MICPKCSRACELLITAKCLPYAFSKRVFALRFYKCEDCQLMIASDGTYSDLAPILEALAHVEPKGEDKSIEVIASLEDGELVTRFGNWSG